MNNVRLFYLLFESNEAEEVATGELIEQWLSELSAEKQTSLKRQLDPAVRLASLLALQLLKKCANEEGIDDFQLEDICYPESAKPYWQKKPDVFDFNITHSGGLIAVAMSLKLRLGIDVEKHRKLKSLNFKKVLIKEELSLIKKRPEMFFDIWAKKEAVVKAANTAGIARMRDVILSQDSAKLDGKYWKLTVPDMNCEGYSAFLASSDVVDELIIKQLTVHELMMSS